METHETHAKEMHEMHETHAKKMKEPLAMIAIVLGLIAIFLSSYAIVNQKTVTVYKNLSANTTTTVPAPVAVSYNITSSLIKPEVSLSDSPIITQNQSFGTRLTNINAPFNATELSIINNASDSYFETAGKMYLNNTLPPNEVGKAIHATPKKIQSFILNGKPVVMYFGSTTCVFCGENRWAMAMALSRFGNFSYLFKGYSAIKDLDLPSVFWAPAHYNYSSTSFGDFYNSKYISFLSIEDSDPITGGFNLNTFPTIQARANATNNLAYIDMVKYILGTNDFGGTPFTVWGAYELGGVDAAIFGNSTPTNNTYPLQSMTHEQVLSQLANPKDQFAWSEYAAADFYIAMVCKTLNNVAPICSLSAIQGIEAEQGS